MEDEGNSINENLLRILVATDNHLGYLEKDPVRGNDSFVTFEEILRKAKELEVDCILLGGDLFHDNKPSRVTIYRTMELLRKYCLGDRPVNIEMLSDQTLNFHSSFKCVNYEDPNYNIEIPIFSIHGNHDDPAGEGGLAALDILSMANLVNYFGKSDNIDDITVYPLLLRKGTTKTAIYGLGNIRDERLYRTFQQKKVKLMRPVESREEWFNILVLHQNRVAHSPKNYIHEVMLDNFLDFVVWGHEHECLITPQPSTVGEYYITQPGSSVATSLSEGESKKKHIGLLEVHGDQFRLKPIALKTVRPFILEEVVLASEELDPNDEDGIVEFLSQRVEEMIAKADSEQERRKKPKPLIRLKVEYSGFTTCNPQRFGQRFVGRVANPNDILLFYRKKTTAGAVKRSKAANEELEKDLLMRALRPDPVDSVKIEDLIGSFLDDPSQALEILPEGLIHEALHLFVDKDEKTAISEFVGDTLKKTQQYLEKEDPSKISEPDAIQTLVSERTAMERIKTRMKEKEEMSEDENEEESPPLSPPAKKGKKSQSENPKTPKAKKSNPPKKGKKSSYSLQIDENGEGHSEDDSEIAKVKDEPLDETKNKKRRITSLTDLLAGPGKKKKVAEKDEVDVVSIVSKYKRKGK